MVPTIDATNEWKADGRRLAARLGRFLHRMLDAQYIIECETVDLQAKALSELVTENDHLRTANAILATGVVEATDQRDRAITIAANLEVELARRTQQDGRG